MAKADRRAKLIAKFCSLTAERVAKLHQGIDALEADPDNTHLPAEVMREIHTVKGEAKIMGFDFINTVAHYTEGLLVAAKTEHFRISSNAWFEIVSGLDYLGALADDPGNSPDELVTAAKAFVEGKTHATSEEKRTTEPQLPSPTDVSGDGAGEQDPDIPPSQHWAGPDPSAEQAPDARSPDEQAPNVGRDRKDDFVHVSGEDLAALTALSGTLVVHDDQMTRLLEDISRIVDDMGHEIDIVEHGAHAATRRSRLQALAREMRATVATARDEAFANQLDIRTLQEHIRELRLLRMSGLLEEQARGGRALARQLGKSVRIRTSGGNVVADKQVIDVLREPVMHIVRNAVDHGIETAEHRVRQEKSADALIELRARHAGGHVEIEISDDGGGIDAKNIRTKIIERAIVDESSAHKLSDDDLLQYVFRSGFSTQNTVSDVSGRGVGLNVVQNRLHSLGGEIRLESNVGVGTRFILRSPVSIALSKALIVRAAGTLLAIPSTTVVRTLRVHDTAIESTADSRFIILDKDRIPLVSLAVIVSGAGQSAASERAIVIISHAEQLLALEVDDFQGEREAVRRALDPFIAGLDLINGTAVIEGGRLVLFLHLRAVCHHAAALKHRTATTHVEQTQPRILVVDDSELTRDMLVSILGRAGFMVREAVDGLDALKILEHDEVDLVLTDLDMPALNGFGLLRRLRESPTHKDLPVIVFSTRGSTEDKEKAMAAGANAYLVKAAFREAEFVRTLSVYLGKH